MAFPSRGGMVASEGRGTGLGSRLVLGCRRSMLSVDHCCGQFRRWVVMAGSCTALLAWGGHLPFPRWRGLRLSLSFFPVPLRWSVFGWRRTRVPFFGSWFAVAWCSAWVAVRGGGPVLGDGELGVFFAWSGWLFRGSFSSRAGLAGFLLSLRPLSQWLFPAAVVWLRVKGVVRNLSVETFVVRCRWASVKSARRYFQAGQWY